jgi:tripartite-type tricarboxylate transporter receptor subunit TctC
MEVVMRRITAMLLLLMLTGVCAAAFPERPVRLILPGAPGGGTDVVARIVVPKLAEVLGQNIVIDYRVGANNIIGTEIAAHAPADGYTLLIAGISHTINPAVYRKLPYDTLRDFMPISHIVNSGGYVIVVHPSFPAHSLAQLIEMARAQPGKINYA